MYNFVSPNKPEAIRDNIRLVHELKNKFAFVYAVCFFVFVS